MSKLTRPIVFLMFLFVSFINPSLSFSVSGNIRFLCSREGPFSSSNYAENSALGDYLEELSGLVLNRDMGASDYPDGGVMSPENKDSYLEIMFMLPTEYDFSEAIFVVGLKGKGTSFGEDNLWMGVMNRSEEFWFDQQYAYYQHYVVEGHHINQDHFDTVLFTPVESEAYHSSQTFTFDSVGNWLLSPRPCIYVRLEVSASDQVDLEFVELSWDHAKYRLDLALDNTELLFYTGGHTPWFGQKDIFYFNGASARSGQIGHGEYSGLYTTVTGPGNLHFYWKVSSEEGHDSLRFYFDGESTPRAQIHGDTDWEHVAFEVPADTHNLTWEYRKDASVSFEEDSGWVDRVSFCTFPITPDSGDFSYSGGEVWVFVDASDGECGWTASSEQLSWVTVNPATGKGDAYVSVRVDPNSGDFRTGNITVAGRTFLVRQLAFDPLSCINWISPLFHAFPAQGGSLEVSTHTSAPECTWTVFTTGVPWVDVTPASGTGDGTVLVTVTPNPGGAREATITIAGQSLSLTQDQGCTFSLTPDTHDFAYFGGSCAAHVEASAEDCSWTASAKDISWVLLGPESDTGDGTVTVMVLPNFDTTRTATITIAGKPFSVRQAYNPSPGVRKWTFQTAGSLFHSSPAIGQDGTVYAGSSSGGLYAINPDGTQKWVFQKPGTIMSSPTIGSDGTIYVISTENVDKGFLYAVNTDGSQKWAFSSHLGSFVWNTCPATDSVGTVYALAWDQNTFDGYLYAITPDGTQNWFFQGAALFSSPAVGWEGTIFIGSGTGDFYAINPDGTKKWVYRAGTYHQFTSAAIDSDGTLYAGSTNDTVFAFRSDGTLKWAFANASYVESSPAIAPDGTIYVGDAHGRLYALNPDGTQKWTQPFQTPASFLESSPGVGADGTVYVAAGDGYLYAVNPGGTQKWASPMASPAYYSSPAIGPDGTVYIGCDDGKLHAFYDESGGLANSPWPMFQHDARHTGRQPWRNLKGDVNGDLRVDLTDALFVLRLISGVEPSQDINDLADVNGDGNIGFSELIYILQYLSSLR